MLQAMAKDENRKTAANLSSDSASSGKGKVAVGYGSRERTPNFSPSHATHASAIGI
jgi:hypothetical protein